MAKVSRTAPILTVSVAAELAGMHAQTVRQYDRLGLVVAKRTRGGGRRYSLNDVDKLAEIQRLSQEEGINLAGISRIFELQNEVEKLQKSRDRLDRELSRMKALAELMRDELVDRTSRENRVFAADASGDVTMAERLDLLRAVLRRRAESARSDVVLWRPRQLTVRPHEDRS